MKTKKISIIVSVVMLLTMVFGAGSVFAQSGPGHPGHPPRGKFLRLETAKYVNCSPDRTLEIPVFAVFECGGQRLTADDCVYSVDHEEVVKVVDGKYVVQNRGVATVTIYAYGTSTQITFEVV